MLIDPAISTAFGFSLSALLAASAAHKATGFAEFAGVLRNYRIAPEAMVAPLAFLAIVIEAALALGLLVPSVRAIAAIGSAGLLSAYGLAMAFNIARGRVDIDCGCSFGASSDRLSWSLVMRTAILALVAILAAAPVSARSLGWADFAFSALFVATAAAFYLTFEALRANWTRFAATERY